MFGSCGGHCGFTAWLEEPSSLLAQKDARLTELILKAWIDSGMFYGFRKLTDDLRDLGERIFGTRVARFASLAGIAAQVGDRRRSGRFGRKPEMFAKNKLELRLASSAPHQVWVTDLT